MDLHEPETIRIRKCLLRKEPLLLLHEPLDVLACRRIEGLVRHR